MSEERRGRARAWSSRAPERLALALLVALATLPGCARSVRVPVPEGIDLVYPAWPPGALRGDDAGRFQRAWEAVLTGDAPRAIREYEKLRASRPGLAAVETGLAYARMRAADVQAAARGFEAALAREPAYLPALLGAGAAARLLGSPDRALLAYRRALEVAPADSQARRRLAEVKLQVTERHVAAAQAARQRGDDTSAVAEYRAVIDAAPELSDVRIELATLLLQSGESEAAVALLEDDPKQDRHVQLALGEVLLSRNEPARALQVYRSILARDPQDAEARRRAGEAQRAVELAQMPAEYRLIAEAARLSRADLAALLAVKLKALQRLPPRQTHVATDISGSWARDHIVRMLALDVMEVYPNHSFQPGASVRRGDLAAALGRVLDLVGAPTRPAPVLRDVSPANLLYPGVSRVVAAGLMDVTPDGAFEAWRPVSGRDAVAVVEALARLLGP